MFNTLRIRTRSAARKYLYNWRLALLKVMHRNHRFVKTRAGSFELYVSPSSSVGQQLLIWHEYERNDSTFLGEHFKDAKVLIDVGANCGYYSLLLASRNPSSQIIAVEPLPEYADLIVRAAKLNGFTNITVERLAIGAVRGSRTLFETRDAALTSLSDSGRSEVVGTSEVRTISLDELASMHSLSSVDFIKIDAEGAEMEILQGATHLLEERIVNMWMIELCEENLASFNASAADIQSLMCKYHYVPFRVINSVPVSFDLDKSPAFRSVNVFYVLPDHPIARSLTVRAKNRYRS